VTERFGGGGRRRFFAEQRDVLAAGVLPTLATAAPLAFAVAIHDAWRGIAPARAIVAEGAIAAALGGFALAVPAMRKTYESLTRFATLATVLVLLAWGLALRLGAHASAGLLVVPFVQLAQIAFVPLPPRAAIAAGVAGYGALLVASPSAPLAVHVASFGAAIAGYALAVARRRRALRHFMATERMAKAVARMQRVQEQLVVVEKLEALRVLVGGIAHELNNALAVSAASTQQAKSLVERDAEQALAALKRGDGGLQRIKATVDRLRRFAMAAEGILEPADVAAMLDFALESAIGRARSGLVIERDYDSAVGTIHCHVSALAEALFQVARNAVEAMPGGGTLRARVRREGDRVVLSVADQGHGIPPEQLARVFDPYYSRAAGKRPVQKSGMGLSAVYGLVSALGGSVKIRSAAGTGTEVDIIMPTRPAAPMKPTPARSFLPQ
jgi:signal transduction histidine kinase